MADCSGEWKNSTIHWTRKNGQPQDPPLTLSDGEFTIDPHPGSAAFTGQHRDPQGNTTSFTQTNCTDSPGTTNKFRITMRRRDLTVTPPQIFLYEGEGTITNPATGEAIIRGRVRVPGPPDPNDTGTWETSRPGGGGDEDEKVEKDKRDKKDRMNKDSDDRGAVGQ